MPGKADGVVFGSAGFTSGSSGVIGWNVEAARSIVLGEGGEPVGDVVTLQTSDGRHVTWAYVTDPEGNILELQSWAPA